MAGFKPASVLLCFGLPALLLLAFFCLPFINVDSIGWRSGFTHPLSGWDHLITMLAVGIWAAQLRGHAIWLLPLAFVGVMSLGGLAGAAGLALPSVEGLILLSCAVFSILILHKARFNTQVNVLIVAFFGFFHGFAHGQEISTSASLISYTLGFMLATLLLHGAGIVVAKLIVFAVTGLVAILFSSLAQANPVKSISAGKSNNIFLAQELGVSQFSHSPPEIGQFNDGEIWRFQTDHDLNGTALAKNCLASTCKVTLSSKAKVLQDAMVSASAQPIVGYGKPAINFHGSAFKNTTFQPQWILQPLPLFYPSNSPCISHQDFKQHYPDINHTPGKDLLSNGVGLNSPPAILAHLVVPQFALSFRKSPVFLFEVRTLQIGFAKALTCNSPKINCPFSVSSIVLENSIPAKYCQQYRSYHLVLNTLFSTPTTLLLLLLPVLIRTLKTKKQSRVEIATFTSFLLQPNPPTIREILCTLKIKNQLLYVLTDKTLGLAWS